MHERWNGVLLFDQRRGSLGARLLRLSLLLQLRGQAEEVLKELVMLRLILVWLLRGVLLLLLHERSGGERLAELGQCSSDWQAELAELLRRHGRVDGENLLAVGQRSRRLHRLKDELLLLLGRLLWIPKRCRVLAQIEV